MKKNSNKKSEALSYLAKYSSIGFKMMAIALVFVFIGIFIDEKLETSKAWFTALFSIIGVVFSVYSGIRDLIK